MCRMYGDYESLRDGSIADCLMDLTAGIPEHYPLHELVTYKNPDTRRGVYYAMFSALETNSLVNLSIRARRPGDVRALTHMGLIVGRAYMVISAKVRAALPYPLANTCVSSIRMYQFFRHSKSLNSLNNIILAMVICICIVGSFDLTGQ